MAIVPHVGDGRGLKRRGEQQRRHESDMANLQQAALQSLHTARDNCVAYLRARDSGLGLGLDLG